MGLKNQTMTVTRDQENIIVLMLQILELSEQSQQIVRARVQEVGVRAFFRGIEILQVSQEERERIQALKEVIENKEKEILSREEVADYAG